MNNIPNHIGFIMDGNGRWASQRGLPRLAGHKSGVDAVRRTLEACKQKGVRCVTLYAFSSENWSRPEDEVNGLMGLLRFYIKSELARLHDEGVNIRVLGDKSALPNDIQELIAQAESLTKNNIVFTLCLALNYGGRAEIAHAATQLAKEGITDITPELLEKKLYTHGLPDPDLIIRTSGEQRLSGFLMWQSAYAEFYFTSVHWPDFSAEELDKALADYASRERRFGGLAETAENVNIDGNEQQV